MFFKLFCVTLMASALVPKTSADGAIFTNAASYGCPDNTYRYQFVNGRVKCYKCIPVNFRAVDRCAFKDVCRRLHPAAMPVMIDNAAEQWIISKYIVGSAIIGEYIPCNVPGMYSPARSVIFEFECSGCSARSTTLVWLLR